MTTESAPPREPPGNAARTPGESHSLYLDSTAELLARVTSQLAAQLGRTSRDGTRTSRDGTRTSREGTRGTRNGARISRNGTRPAPGAPAVI